MSCQIVRKKPGRPFLCLASINLCDNRPDRTTRILLKRPKPFASVQKPQSIFLPDWMLDFSILGHYFLLKIFICLRAPVTPRMRKKSHPQNSNELWWECIWCAVTALFYRPAAEWRQTLPVCVCTFDSTFNTLSFFMQGETPHGSNSLCKQNLMQNRPPINSRQPCARTFRTQSQFLCPPPPTVHHKNSTFLSKKKELSNVVTLQV